MIRLRWAVCGYAGGMSIDGIRGVTFDAGWTLIAPEPSVGVIYAEIAQNHGIAAEAVELERRFQTAFGQRAAIVGVTSEEEERSFWTAVIWEVFDGIACAEDINHIFAALWDTFAESRRWRPLPDAANVIRELRRRGYTVAILSNWDSRLHTVITGLGWTAWLDGIFVSADVGFAKPDRAIFDHAARTLNLQPGELLHVGDNASADGAGAIGAGWNAALIGGGHEGALTISNLGELLQHLR